MKKVLRSTLTLDNAIVRDHRIYGQSLLPGLAYVDMLYAVAEQAVDADFRRYALEDVTIAHPLRVSNSQPVDVSIAFEGAPSAWTVTVDGREHNGAVGEKRRYASAVLRLCDHAHLDTRIDVAALKGRALRRMDMEQVYAEALTRGLDHRGVIKARGLVYIDASGCLVDLSVDDRDLENLERYRIHPALLDGAAMASAAFRNATDDATRRRLYIPLHYRSFEAGESLRRSCYAVIQVASFSTVNDIQKMDIDFFNTEGRQVAALKGMTAKVVRSADQIRSGASPRVLHAQRGTTRAAVVNGGADRGAVEKTLRKIYSGYLDVEPADLDLDAGFFDLGFESVHLLQVLKDTEKAFGVSLSPTLLFEKSNLRELMEHITRLASHGAPEREPNRTSVEPVPVAEPSTFVFAESEPFLRDHLVSGQPALMGVTHPCLVVECSALPVSLRRVEFAGGPVMPKSGELVSVRVTSDPEAGRFMTNALVPDWSGEKRCCFGEISGDVPETRPRVAIDRILGESRSLSPRQVEQFYSFVKEYAIGPMLRVIESASVYRQSTLVLKVSLQGKTRKGNLSGMALDPLLLNACYYFLDADGAAPRERLFVPLFIERLTVFRPMTETAFIVNTVRVQKSDYIAFDAMVFTESGECIAEVVNASLKEVPHPELLANASFRPAVTSPQPGPTALDIAIVGMSGRFPQSRDLKAFWEALRAGRDCITEIPADRWDWRDYYSEDRTKPGSIYSKWGGFIEDVDRFDARFFGISPREAEGMDPQERLFLEHCWMALEDAGYTRQKLQAIGAPETPGNVGVYVGVMSNEYPLFAAEASALGSRIGVGSNTSTIAARVSFVCDLHGPSMSIDTMCSSSVTAIETAARALADHRIGAALAGGVNVTIHPNKYLMLSQGQFISSKGRCESFGEGGDGYIPGEGVGALLLKRLSDAERDGDHIYGVIKGAALNHVGRTGGYTVPSPQAQGRVIASALKEAGIHPETVSYIEAHGTGTKLGDPVEIAGLSAAFGEQTASKRYCWLGSVKSNIGHCEAAAGVAGVMKVLLQMQHREIVPSLHSAMANPAIRFEDTPFVVNQTLREWKRPVWNGMEQPRRAGVSSFGAGGANAHVVLEEYVRREPGRVEPPLETESVFLIVLSAKREDALRTIAANLRVWLAERRDSVRMEDLAFTLQTGRETMNVRLAMLADSAEDLDRKLGAFLEGRTDDDTHFGDGRKNRDLLAALEDDDVAGLIDSWLAKKKFGTLLDFWAKGGTVSWEQLHRDTTPRLLSLPVYPFARERYWLPVEIQRNRGPSDASAAASSAVAVLAGLPVHTFEEVWVERLLPEGRRVPGTVVCFLDTPEYRRALAQSYQQVVPGGRLVFVPTVSSVERPPSASGDANALKAALETIAAEHGGVDTVLDLRAVDDDTHARDVQRVHRLVEALAASPAKPARLLLGGLFVDPLDQCFLDAWIGVERSLKHSLPEMRVAVVHGDGDARGLLAHVLVEALQPEPSSVLYTQGRRHVCKVRPIGLESTESRLRHGGTYLITGGLGHVGLVFAKHLATKFGANLILVGRSPLDDGRRTILETLSSLGGQAMYVAADVTDERGMSAAVEQGLASFGAIHGVIHGAGSQPESVLRSDARQLHAVIDPKIRGTVVLERVLEHIPLDFICYFSSTAAVLGDLGSCDYSIANRFQAAFARYRNRQCALGNRRGFALAMLWPIWRVGGIGFGDAAQREHYLRASGQRMLETDEGLDLFERALASRQEQCLVLAGEAERIGRLLKPQDWRPNPVVAPVVSRRAAPQSQWPETRQDGASPDAASLTDRLTEEIRKTVSEILKLPAGELDVSENWVDFGFDSVTLMEFATALTRRYGVEVNPVRFYSQTSISSLVQSLIADFGVAVAACAPPVSAEPPTIDESVPAGVLPVADSREVRTIPKVLDTRLEPIAIIGMSGRFPQSRSVDELWRILVEGRDAVEEIHADRFDWREIHGNPLEDATKTPGKWCGSVPGVYEFDPLFFAISPREAEAMDPRQRLLLMEAWKALEDAGYGEGQLRDRPIGMFVGVESGEFTTPIGQNAGLLSNHEAILAARLSYFLNLRGPNIAINTACSSGLVAAHLACQSLRNEECSTAIVAGVNVLLKPDAFVLMGQAGMLSADGRCFAFDARANGIVPAEAVVAVVLKRLSDAERDGDPIHAVIAGSGINYDGKTNGITAPSGASQSELLKATYDRFGVDPKEISYVVTHGTGTQLGDPIEVNALFDAFRGSTLRRGYCALTSTKSNLGHTMAASGLVSLVNLVEAMHHDTIPASIHCTTENDFISWKQSPFFVNKENRPWPRAGQQRRIGAISSFGMSGTNAHMVVQDHPGAAAPPVDADRHWSLLVLSAKSRDALARRVLDMIRWTEGEDARRCSLSQVACTLLTGRHHFEYRCSIVARDLDEARRLWEGVRPEDFHQVTRERRASRRPHAADVAEPRAAGLSREAVLTLADRYCQGEDLDAASLFPHGGPQRVHLPTYPFSVQSFDGRNLTTPARAAQQPVVAPTSSPTPDGLDAYLVQMVSDYLRLPAAELDLERDLDEFGLDSIGAAALVHQMSKRFGEIPTSLFLECRTLRDVERYLVRSHPAEVEALHESDDARMSVMAGEPATQDAPFPPTESSARGVSRNISIVGMAGLFPGASSIDVFLDALHRRVPLTTALPERRRQLLGVAGEAEHRTLPRGGYLADVEYFDHRLFKLSLEEAREIDPQLRKLLEVITQAIADAGMTLRQFRQARTGLFVATKGNSGYQEIAAPLRPSHLPVETPALYANRISNILNLPGPSEVVDTGCSSFLVAVKQAVAAIRGRRCEQAIVAAAEMDLSPLMLERHDTIGLYSRQSATRSFCADSDGYLKSEAVGAIVITPEDVALRKGLPSHANIKGVGVCHGGKAPLKWYSPNIRGQKLAIEEALADSGVDPSTVTYIEAEANGSQLGDASEIAAIQAVYGPHLRAADPAADRSARLWISSIKPLVGHAENASTFTSLVRLIDVIRTGRMPEVSNLEELNKGITLEPEFEILRDERSWPRQTQRDVTLPRRGAVHSLAIGGVNAHLILEETMTAAAAPASLHRDGFVFVFSEETGEKRRQLVNHFCDFLSREGDQFSSEDLLSVEFTLQAGREALPCRLAVVAASARELRHVLQAWLEGETASGVYDSENTARPTGTGLVHELAATWAARREVDWSPIRPDRPVRRRHLPANPLERVYCWHREVSLDEPSSDGETAGLLFLAPQWKVWESVGRPELHEAEHVVAACGWDDERVESLGGLLGGAVSVRVVRIPEGAPVSERFGSAFAQVFEIVQESIRSLSVQPSPAIVQVIVPGGVENLYLHGIAGLLRTAGKEHSRLHAQLIELAPEMPLDDVVGRIRECRQHPAESTIRFAGDQRLVEAWSPVGDVDTKSPSSPFRWKDRGVYLVTGGVGGLGRIVAGHIATATRGATLILTGRSPVSEAIRRVADEIHACGARVIYEQVDVTDQVEVGALVERIGLECGVLTAVLHCAGVIDDRSITKKTVEEVARVLAPKVAGVCHLDEATRRLPLDHFILFSSVSSVFGNAGQADYAGANAFLNAFAEFRNHEAAAGRRHGRTVSIAWPLWADGRMDVDAASKALLRRRYSLIPMPTAEGLRALEAAIGSPHSELCVLYGSASRVLEAVSGGALQ